MCLEMGLSSGETLLSVIVALCLISFPASQAKLTENFYQTSCPLAELFVFVEVYKAVNADPGIAAGLLRLHFHDCFVGQGCEGSVLINSTPGNTAEKDAPPNRSLRGFEVINNAKSKLEDECKGVVSCADILAFAARDSVVLSGGRHWPVAGGRKDGRVSKATDTTDLPPAGANLPSLLPFFTKKGLNQQQMIALSGAHTIGQAHCGAFSKRLYNFNATVATDPALDKAYADKLKEQCPPRSNNTVYMDPPSPTRFDTSYYRSILNNRGLFTSDQTLVSTPDAEELVKKLSESNDAFQQQFIDAMVAMGEIGVLTDESDGEIRANCSVINPLT